MTDIYLRFAVWLAAVAWNGATQLCERCDCVLSEDTWQTRGVINVKPRCSEGKVKWTRPYGALRLELHPGYSSDFQACIMVHSVGTRTQCSQDSWSSIPANYRLLQEEDAAFSLKPLATVEGRGRELCVSSTGEPVRLYFETEKTAANAGAPRLTIHYEIERKSGSLLYNPLQECRPCNEEELLEAYCSSDFVVIGTMANVTHSDMTDHTELRVQVSQVIQQNGDYFRRTRRDSTYLEGTILAPRKCDIRHGVGHFLFTGRIRLGHPTLHCAPFLDHWRDIFSRAKENGDLECNR